MEDKTEVMMRLHKTFENMETFMEDATIRVRIFFTTVAQLATYAIFYSIFLLLLSSL